MSSKFGLSVALLLAASAAAAQPPAAAPAAPQWAPTPDQQASIQRTATAFGQCISAGVQGLPASVTPEAGATTILAGCAAQRSALAQSVDAMIATMPEAQRAPAHAQFESQIGQAPAQIAAGIRQSRAAPAAPPPAQH